jgi:hypothetical protein
MAADETKRPSGEIATAVTAEEWPANTSCGLLQANNNTRTRYVYTRKHDFTPRAAYPVATSQSRTVLSAEPVTR